MQIIATEHLNDSQTCEILTLMEACKTKDSIRISLPTDPEDKAAYFLFYENSSGQNLLVSALSILFYNDQEAECIAFTHPNHRRRGYFEELLSYAQEHCPILDECDILFPFSGTCPDTMNTFQALEAELCSQEHQMSLDLDTEQTAITNRNTGKDFYLECSTDQNEIANWNFVQNHPETSRLLGSCRTSRISSTAVCLHHVEILPQYRNRGYGTIFLKLLIQNLVKNGCLQIILQVAGDNLPALALYKKQGFQITETLSYYLY